MVRILQDLDRGTRGVWKAGRSSVRGYGRELAEFGIRELTNIQTIWVGPADTPLKQAAAE